MGGHGRAWDRDDLTSLMRLFWTQPSRPFTSRVILKEGPLHHSVDLLFRLAAPNSSRTKTC